MQIFRIEQINQDILDLIYVTEKYKITLLILIIN